MNTVIYSLMLQLDVIDDADTTVAVMQTDNLTRIIRATFYDKDSQEQIDKSAIVQLVMARPDNKVLWLDCTGMETDDQEDYYSTIECVITGDMIAIPGNGMGQFLIWNAEKTEVIRSQKFRIKVGRKLDNLDAQEGDTAYGALQEMLEKAVEEYLKKNADKYPTKEDLSTIAQIFKGVRFDTQEASILAKQWADRILGESEPDTPTDPTPEEPDAPTLVSISAVYNGVDVEVGTDPTGLSYTVTAHYSDGSTSVIRSGYVISGTISAGQNIITILYDGKTTTVTVTGIAEDEPVDDFSFEGVISTKGEPPEGFNKIVAGEITSTAGGTTPMYVGRNTLIAHLPVGRYSIVATNNHASNKDWFAFALGYVDGEIINGQTYPITYTNHVIKSIGTNAGESQTGNFNVDDADKYIMIQTTQGYEWNVKIEKVV